MARPNESLPTFISGEHLAGKTDTEVVVSGNAELRKRNSILQSDRLTFWQETQEVEAEGNVRLLRDGDNVRGPKMRMKTESATGFFEKPDYVIRRSKTAAPSLWTGTEESTDPKLTTGRGSASWLDFEGEGKYHLTDATYTTCSPAAGTSPDWFARTTDLRLNYDDEVGTAKNATLYFKGMPILYAPWMTFSLNNERKSGLLAPTLAPPARVASNTVSRTTGTSRQTGMPPSHPA
jgi:LPS-assembly protein